MARRPSLGHARDPAGLTAHRGGEAGWWAATEVAVLALLVAAGVAAGVAMTLPARSAWLIAGLWAGFAVMGFSSLILYRRLRYLVAELAQQKARAADLAREREALLRDALHVSERERQRLAADLHDGVIQLVSAVTLRTATVARRLRRPSLSPSSLDEAAASLDRVTVDLQAVTGDLRSLMGALAGDELQGDGLTGPLSALLLPLAETGVSIDLSVGEVGCDAEVRNLMHRVAQELVRNIAKHATARRVAVSVSQGPGVIALRLSDDGRGFDPTEIEQHRNPGHLGLRLLEQRVRDAGGELRIESAPGRGTTVDVTLPLVLPAPESPLPAPGLRLPA